MKEGKDWILLLDQEIVVFLQLLGKTKVSYCRDSELLFPLGKMINKLPILEKKMIIVMFTSYILGENMQWQYQVHLHQYADWIKDLTFYFIVDSVQNQNLKA